jgi:pyruvate formate lyase activating enzyme
MKGTVFNIQRFCLHDGPGIRTAVFFKGCPLRCAWCHNPEGQSSAPETMVKAGRKETCGYRIGSAELAARLKRDADIFRDSGGGVTFTGGEPLAQPGFLLEVMDLLGSEVNKAVETCGFSPEPVFKAVTEKADYMLFDIKHTDSGRHRFYTGKGNERILANLRLLCASGKPFVARIPLIPGVNDSRENLERTAGLLEGVENLVRVELLRYHKTAGAKYPMLGRTYDPPFDTDRSPEVHDCFTDKGIQWMVL